MVHWMAEPERARESYADTKVIFTLFGLYTWEILQTAGFEWSMITGKRKLFFYLCRYCMLLALIGLITSYSVSSPINCQALYTFNSWTGNMAILCASTSLMLRTIALWDRDKRVIAVLGFFCLCHWSVLYRGMFIVHATYSAQHFGCIVTSSNHIFLDVTFFATMAFDFLVLCFTLAALLQQKARTDLWRLLFQDGLVYFFISFVCNVVPAILSALNFNPIMNIIATVPATTISSIAACRLVMRLQDYKYRRDTYVHTRKQVVTRSATRGHLHFNSPPLRIPEIVVTTDQIVMDDFRVNLDPAATFPLSKEGVTDTRRDLEAGVYSGAEFGESRRELGIKSAAF